MRSYPRLLATLCLAVSLSLGVAGCSGGSGSGSEEPSRADLIDDIAAELDVEPAVAECFAAAYEDVGISLEDVQEVGRGTTPDDVDPQEFGEASVAALDCLPADQRDDLIDDATAEDTGAARDGFVSSFVATAPEGTTEEQAGCVFDELIDAGVKLSEMASATLSPETQLALNDAVETCGLA